jgi:hypothetical protein
MDRTVPLEATRKVAALFPNSTFVPVAEAGHGSVFESDCAAHLASEFVETLQVGDLGCTRRPQTVWPAVGRFPLLARDARAARENSNGSNQIGVAERKVVTVAVATVTDHSDSRYGYAFLAVISVVTSALALAANRLSRDQRALERECLVRGLIEHNPALNITAVGSLEEWMKMSRSGAIAASAAMIAPPGGRRLPKTARAVTAPRSPCVTGSIRVP